jgi:RNA polymerase sigma-70 factor, ECF subfamily
MCTHVSELHSFETIDHVQKRSPISETRRVSSKNSHTTRHAVPMDDLNQHSELFRRYSPQLYRQAYALLRNREDAEDALQNSWLNVLANLQSFQGRSSVSTWLTRIVINCSLMILRKKRRGKEFSLDTADHGPEADMLPWLRSDSADPEQVFLDAEKKRVVDQAISKLRPRVRAVLELAQLKELTIKDTARSLGISTPAAKGRLFHARAALRNSPAIRAMAGK